MKKKYALVDCNSFYASCEKVFRPDLRHRPVVVLSNNDGCIIARSAEAKQLGIKMGMPFFMFKEQFKNGRVTVFSSNYTLYGDLSARVMQVLGQFAPRVEVYSIDEAFLDLSGCPEALCCPVRIKTTVWQNVGIPVSVGVGATKALAKLANHLAKKHPRFGDGVCDLDKVADLSALFHEVPLEEVWGIGSRYAHMLAGHGVHTVAEFLALPERWVLQRMTVVGQRLHRELHGHSCLPLELVAAPKKAICTSRSFGKPLEKYTEVEDALSHYVARAAFKLRKQQSRAGYLQVFLETNRFKAEEPQYRKSLGMRLPVATGSTLALTRHARLLLKKIFKEGYRYKKTGVLLADFCRCQEVQLAFAFGQEGPADRLMETVDTLNERYGHGMVKMASEGKKQSFWMRQHNISPRYTTSLADLPVVNCQF